MRTKTLNQRQVNVFARVAMAPSKWTPKKEYFEIYCYTQYTQSIICAYVSSFLSFLSTLFFVFIKIESYKLPSHYKSDLEQIEMKIYMPKPAWHTHTHARDWQPTWASTAPLKAHGIWEWFSIVRVACVCLCVCIIIIRCFASISQFDLIFPLKFGCVRIEFRNFAWSMIGKKKRDCQKKFAISVKSTDMPCALFLSPHKL